MIHDSDNITQVCKQGFEKNTKVLYYMAMINEERNWDIYPSQPYKLYI